MTMISMIRENNHDNRISLEYRSFLTCLIRPNKNICVVPVTLPSLLFRLKNSLP